MEITFDVAEVDTLLIAIGSVLSLTVSITSKSNDLDAVWLILSLRSLSLVSFSANELSEPSEARFPFVSVLTGSTDFDRVITRTTSFLGT